MPTPQYPTTGVQEVSSQKWKAGEVPTDANGNPAEYSAFGYVFDAGTPYPKSQEDAQAIAAKVNLLQQAETPQTSQQAAQANALQRTQAEGNTFGQAQVAQADPAQKPLWDPLALQAMWGTVFKPIFDQVAKISGGSAQDYLANMNSLIAGSHQSPQAMAQDQSQAGAQAQLLQQLSKSSLQGVAAQPSFDALIAALQQASGAAQLYQGEAQKAIAYGTNLNAAQAFSNPGGGTTPTGTGTLTPTQTAALLQGALAGSQTSNPLMPQAPPSSVTGQTQLP